MHEMAILGNVVDVVLKHAEENNANKVISVTLVVGELHDVVDSLMESCFRFLARNTLASDATLTLVKIPLKVQCKNCLLVFPASVGKTESLVCPDCGQKNFTIKAGKEFYIQNIEVT